MKVWAQQEVDKTEEELGMAGGRAQSAERQVDDVLSALWR